MFMTIISILCILAAIDSVNCESCLDLTENLFHNESVPIDHCFNIQIDSKQFKNKYALTLQMIDEMPQIINICYYFIFRSKSDSHLLVKYVNDFNNSIILNSTPNISEYCAMAPVTDIPEIVIIYRHNSGNSVDKEMLSIDGSFVGISLLPQNNDSSSYSTGDFIVCEVENVVQHWAINTTIMQKSLQGELIASTSCHSTICSHQLHGSLAPVSFQIVCIVSEHSFHRNHLNIISEPPIIKRNVHVKAPANATVNLVALKTSQSNSLLLHCNVEISPNLQHNALLYLLFMKLQIQQLCEDVNHTIKQCNFLSCETSVRKNNCSTRSRIVCIEAISGMQSIIVNSDYDTNEFEMVISVFCFGFILILIFFIGIKFYHSRLIEKKSKRLKDIEDATPIPMAESDLVDHVKSV